MTRTPVTTVRFALALIAAAALAGCDQSSHNIGAGPDEGNEANAVNVANVALPPPIAASKVYRCKDNSIVYIDWVADNKSADIRAEKNGAPARVTAAEAGKPMTAQGGYSLTGSASAPSVTLALPGKGSQSCKA
jgi:hypothetical protein